MEKIGVYKKRVKRECKRKKRKKNIEEEKEKRMQRERRRKKYKGKEEKKNKFLMYQRFSLEHICRYQTQSIT